MVGKSRFITIADQGVSSLSNFVAVAIIARSGSPQEFGQFALAYAGLMLLLGAQRALVCETLLVRFSQQGALTKKIHSAALGSSLGLAMVGATVLVSVMFLASDGEGGIWGVLAIAAPFILLQDTLRYLFICDSRPYLALILDITWAVLSIGGMLLLMEMGADTQWVAAVWGGGAAVSLVIGMTWVRRIPSIKGGAIWLWDNRDCSIRYLTEFLTLNASTLLVVYLLVAPIGATGVGALRAALLLFSPLNTAFSALKVAVLPDLVRSSGTALFRKRILETGIIITALAIIWGGTVLALGPSIGQFILGPMWEPASELRWAYAFQYLLMAPYTLILAYCRAVEANKLSTRMRGSLAIGTLLIPLFLAVINGTIAAAWGFAVAMLIAVVTGGIGILRGRSTGNDLRI